MPLRFHKIKFTKASSWLKVYSLGGDLSNFSFFSMKIKKNSIRSNETTMTFSITKHTK